MKQWLISAAQFFAVIFAGFVLANICAIASRCIFNGFDVFGSQVLQLPYLLYLIASIVLSAILAAIVHVKSK